MLQALAKDTLWCLKSNNEISAKDFAYCLEQIETAAYQTLN